VIKKAHKRFGVEFPDAGHSIIRSDVQIKGGCVTSYVDVIADASDPTSDVIDTIIVRHELDEVGGVDVNGARIYGALLAGHGAIHCESLGLSGEIGLVDGSANVEEGEAKPVVGYYVGAAMAVEVDDVDNGWTTTEVEEPSE